jgi:hypothetical protein
MLNLGHIKGFLIKLHPQGETPGLQPVGLSPVLSNVEFNTKENEKV